MIGSLKGILARKRLPAILVDVAGVGYEVRTSLATLEGLPAEGAAVSLEVLTLFRNESLELYGFRSAEEKSVFVMLLGVSGVGPKIALSLLSALPAPDLAAAIRTDKPQVLERVPGVGRKTAQRVVLELKEKFRDWQPDTEGARAAEPAILFDDAVAALENLGYRRAEAEKALAQVGGKSPGGDLATLLRQALRQLGAAQ